MSAPPPSQRVPADLRVDWKSRPEGGGLFALTLLARFAQVCGRHAARVLLYPITLYFLIVRGPERRASIAYLSRVLPRPPRLFDVARHVHAFASTILDRVFLLSRSFTGFDVRVEGLDALHEDMDRGRGVLLLGSHHGSFEVLRVLSEQRPDAIIAVVLDRSQNPAITGLLEAMNPVLARHVIDAGQDSTAIVLAIREALERGALVGLLADRARVGQASQECRFLGAQAPFPVAPWLIASVMHVPVQLCFGLYRGGARYDLYFERFAEDVNVPRRERGAALAALMQRYAGRLEHHVRLAPFNWFNFYDFWRSDGADKTRVHEGTAGTDSAAQVRSTIDALAGAVDDGGDAGSRQRSKTRD